MRRSKSRYFQNYEILKQSMLYADLENLHKRLGLSKRRLTFLIENPGYFLAWQLEKIIELSGKSYEDFKPFLKP